jgi:hypothetical protein
MKHRKIIFYTLMLTTYLVLAFFITGLGAMFMGIADYALVITFGVINMCVANFYFKIEPLRSIFIGFLISAVGLILSYMLWMPISNLNIADDIIILGFISNAVFQALTWMFVEKYIVRKNRIKTFALFLSMVIVILVSFNLYDFWKFEKYYNWNEKKQISIKATDSTGELIVGDSIRLTTERQPLYGLIAGSLIKKTITDKNGISEFELYLGNKHRGRIWKNGKLGYYFEISKDELFENDTIEIKTTANTVYN